MQTLDDWSPLLAVVAQSAAALVAIIGGFVVARLIQLSTDRAARRIHVEHLRNDLTRVREDLDQVASRLLLFHTAQILSRALSRIDEGTFKSADLPQMVKDYRRSKPMLNIDIGNSLEGITQRIMQASDKATAEVESLKNSDALPLTYDELRRERGATQPPLEDRIFMSAFNAVRGYGNLPGNGPSHVQRSLSSDSPPEVILDSEDDYVVVSDELRTLLRKRGDLQDSILQAHDRMKEDASPIGLWATEAVLVYLTLSGIVVPLLYLARKPAVDMSEPVFDAPWQISHLQIVLGLFISGLAFLFVYVSYLIVALRRKPTGEAVLSSDTSSEPPTPCLPSTPDEYPAEHESRIRNAMQSYLGNKGIAVQYMQSEVPGVISLNFSYRSVSSHFSGNSEYDVLRKAYKAVYDQQYCNCT